MNIDAMDRIPHVSAAMTPFPYSIDAGAGVDEAQRMMAEHDVHHLPVTDGGHLVALVSVRDLERSAAGGDAAERLTVRAACGTPLYCVQTTAPLDVVLTEMAEQRLETVVVLKGEKLAGIFTHTDVCRRFADLLRQMFPKPGGDEAA